MGLKRFFFVVSGAADECKERRGRSEEEEHDTAAAATGERVALSRARRTAGAARRMVRAVCMVSGSRDRKCGSYERCLHTKTTGTAA